MASALDAYLPYLFARWQAGCENGVQLWREFKEQGYGGSRKMVAVWAAHQRQSPAKTGPHKYQTPEFRQRRERAHQERKQNTPSSKRLSYFLMREPEKLTQPNQVALQQLKELSADIAPGYALGQEFLRMVRKESREQCDAWLDKVKASNLQDLQSFAAGLEHDKAAVLAGLNETWSNGPVEG